MRTAREEELMIEVERLKAWLGKIENEAWKNQISMATIERMAGTAIQYGSCGCQPEWQPSENWAKIGLWPSNTSTKEPA